MPFNERTKSRYVAGMRCRLSDLRSKAGHSLDVAIDTMMLASAEQYIAIETGLAEIERMAALIEEELSEVRELAHAQRMEARLEFIEDRFEDFDSEIHRRPKRRRRTINLFAFFRAAAGGGDQAASRGEIFSREEAYQTLGLQNGSSMDSVTRAFRRKAKKLHPDINHGDRTAEPALCRIIEAYRYLKSAQ